MENTPFDHKETHDFMNVESFSQLPFIRPTVPYKEKGIRLFGKEFGGGETTATATATTTSLDESYTTTVAAEDAKETCHDNNGGENIRKFECQYCCRNFPTSQALGGHQNAHKRERQIAKRAHLQSAMMHAGGLAEATLPAHMYGLMNYRRLGFGAVAATTTTTPLSYNQDNWNKNHFAYTSSSRLYDNTSDGVYSQPPINGSPLALWRIPTAHSSATFNPRGGGSMHPQPLLGNLEFKNPQVMSSTTSQMRLGYDQSRLKMKDQVSLDLHL